MPDNEGAFMIEPRKLAFHVALAVFCLASRAPGADDAPAAAKDEPLFSSQEMISRRYKRFEDTLSKIYETLKKTDPERAELLLRAIGKSKEGRISTQMTDLVQVLRDNRQLGDAIERQGDLVSQLQALLDLLLSEDRQKELREEQARIKRYLEELNKIISKQKGARADNERGAPSEDVAGLQKKIADQTGKLNKNIDNDDREKQSRERNNGESSDGKPAGEDARPQPGNPADGKPEPSPPQDGAPGEGEPKKGQPQPGQPGQPKPGQDSGDEGQPPQQQTAGREELEKARRAMQQAIEKLQKKQRQDASDEQDEALSNLQKAKEKLEEILRQLREEERDRFLAMLEARFQRMLAMQLLVYDGTAKLAKTPDEARSGRHSTRALQLAREEEQIAIEASKAITLLHDEGTAVAFPEAVEQVRDDMRVVVIRLERTDIGELTQGIEREIIDALEEMIEALQKEMEKSKEKKDQQQPPPEGQQGDPPLVDQLAELKMLRTLQLRVNRRTRTLGQMVEGEQAVEPDTILQLQNLADRQARIQRATHDIVTGKNK